MTSPTDQRRAFDAAIETYRSGNTAGALSAFVAITAANSGMSDAWLGRLACGDHGIAVLLGAHENSRSLYRETRRIGLVDGDLHARIDAPLYVTMPVWSRATIALAYATALISERHFDTAIGVLEDPVVTGDAMAAQWRQFVGAAAYHVAKRWPDVLVATAKSPPPHATHVIADLTAAVDTLAASAAASLGQFQTALDRAATVATTNQYIAADAALTKGWCLRELGHEDDARANRSSSHGRRHAPRRCTAGVSEPRLPADRHRRRNHRHPHRPVGSGAPRRRKAQRAAAALAEQQETRCWPRRRPSWTS